MSGDLVRCKVGAVANCRPDKVGEAIWVIMFTIK